MLTPATLQDIQTYGETVYRLALDPSRTSYPAYFDGIKTKAEFFADAARAVSDENAELLLFRAEDAVEGWLSYFRLPNDRYLQLTACHLARNTAQALSELLARLEDRFPGDTAYFGFPGENREAIDFLAAHGFFCMEQSWNHSFFFGGDLPTGFDPCVEKISRTNFDHFRALYRPDAETYWTADRIWETLENWTIFVYRRGETPLVTVFLTGSDGHFEIFGTEFAVGFCETAFRALLVAALGDCERQGAKFLTYLCEDDKCADLRALGFRPVGQYRLYTKPL